MVYLSFIRVISQTADIPSVGVRIAFVIPSPSLLPPFFRFFLLKPFSRYETAARHMSVVRLVGGVLWLWLHSVTKPPECAVPTEYDARFEGVIEELGALRVAVAVLSQVAPNSTAPTPASAPAVDLREPSGTLLTAALGWFTAFASALGHLVGVCCRPAPRRPSQAALPAPAVEERTAAAAPVQSEQRSGKRKNKPLRSSGGPLVHLAADARLFAGCPDFSELANDPLSPSAPSASPSSE